MASRFIGRYEHSLDGKGRLILPARFRSNFESVAVLSKYNERCLALWGPADYDRKAEEMAALLDGSMQERAQARSFFGGSFEVDVDRQGRVAVPPKLREYAGMELNSTVLVQGAYSHIELWNPERWALQEMEGDAGLGGEPPHPAPPSPTLTAPAATED